MILIGLKSTRPPTPSTSNVTCHVHVLHEFSMTGTASGHTHNCPRDLFLVCATAGIVAASDGCLGQHASVAMINIPTTHSYTPAHMQGLLKCILCYHHTKGYSAPSAWFQRGIVTACHRQNSDKTIHDRLLEPSMCDRSLKRLRAMSLMVMAQQREPPTRQGRLPVTQRTTIARPFTSSDLSYH